MIVALSLQVLSRVFALISILIQYPIYWRGISNIQRHESFVARIFLHASASAVARLDPTTSEEAFMKSKLTLATVALAFAVLAMPGTASAHFDRHVWKKVDCVLFGWMHHGRCKGYWRR
jgi:hypothetical protein